MFVWVLLAQPPGNRLYIVGVFGREQYALEQLARYLRQHPTADVTIERYAVIDGAR
jgi:hypothetical protein